MLARHIGSPDSLPGPSVPTIPSSPREPGPSLRRTELTVKKRGDSLDHECEIGHQLFLSFLAGRRDCGAGESVSARY